MEQIEEPLLVAAAVGLSYMVPSHEALRDLQRVKGMLQRAVPTLPDGKVKTELQMAWRLTARTDELVNNLAKVFKRGRFRELRLDIVARQAYDLIKDRIADSGITTDLSLQEITVLPIDSGPGKKLTCSKTCMRLREIEAVGSTVVISST